MGTRPFGTHTSRLVPTILPLTDEQVEDLAEGEPGSTHVLLLVDDRNQEEIAVLGTAKELDTWVRRASRLAAGMFAYLRGRGAGRVLADELRRAGVAPTEDVGLEVADRLLIALEMAGLGVVDRRERNEEREAAVLPQIPAGRSVTIDRLVPGQVVKRYTDQRGSKVSVELPCCPVLGRRVVLPAEDRHEAQVVCPFCDLLYEARLADDGDEGLWAYLTVAGPVAVAQRRPSRARRSW